MYLNQKSNVKKTVDVNYSIYKTISSIHNDTSDLCYRDNEEHIVRQFPPYCYSLRGLTGMWIGNVSQIGNKGILENHIYSPFKINHIYSPFKINQLIEKKTKWRNILMMFGTFKYCDVIA